MIRASHAARVQHAGARAISKSAACRPRRSPARPAPMAAPARSTARSPANSGSTCARPTCTASTACPTLPRHEAIPGHVWQGEYANKLPLIRTLLAFNAYSRRLGALRRAAGRRARRLRRLPGRPPRLSPVDRLPRLPAGGRHRPPRQALDAASRASQFFVDATAPTRSKSRARSTAIAAGRARPAATRSATATINRQRDKAKAALGARYDLGRSTTRWCLAATSRWTCWRTTSTIISRGPSA